MCSLWLIGSFNEPLAPSRASIVHMRKLLRTACLHVDHVEFA